MKQLPDHQLLTERYNLSPEFPSVTLSDLSNRPFAIRE